MKQTDRELFFSNRNIILFVSILILGSILAISQLLILLKTSKQNIATPDQKIVSETLSSKYFDIYLPENESIPNCQSMADGSSIPENTVCIVKPNEVIQTYSAIKVWSYNTQEWINPPKEFIDEDRVLLNKGRQISEISAPVIIKCPWGCTLGYP